MSLGTSAAMLVVPLLLHRQNVAASARRRVDAIAAAADWAARTGGLPNRSADGPHLFAESLADPVPPTLVGVPMERVVASRRLPSTTTTAARVVHATVHPTTTTTAPRRRPTSPAATTTTTARPRNVETGGASWYDAGPGTCAHRSAPIGTVITVTNLSNGRSTRCRVTTRGPYADGRVIDLSRGAFSQIADPSAGVIDVRISWS